MRDDNKNMRDNKKDMKDGKKEYEGWQKNMRVNKRIWGTTTRIWGSTKSRRMRLHLNPLPVTGSSSLPKLLHRPRHRHPVLVSIPDKISLLFALSDIFPDSYWWIMLQSWFLLDRFKNETHFKTAEARVRCSLSDQVSIGVCFSFRRCWTPDILSSSELN